MIGILAFAWILYNIDLARLGDSLSGMDPYYLIGILPLFFLLIYVKTLRWSLILNEKNIHLPMAGLFRSYMSSFFAGGVTPGRLGEMLKYRYVRENGYGVAESVSSAIGDRLWDFAFLVVIGWLGFPFVYPLSAGQKSASIISIAGLLIFAFLLFKYWKFITGFVEKKLLKFVPEKHRDGISRGSSIFIDVLIPGKPLIFVKLGLLTVLSWIFYYTHFYLLSL